MNEYDNYDQAKNAAKKLEMTATIGEGFDVAIQGNQTFGYEWDVEKKRSVCHIKDEYDMALDLSENDGKRIGKVTVKLPGFEIELASGWFHAKTDYGWGTYVEYDAPNTWKRNVLKEDWQ